MKILILGGTGAMGAPLVKILSEDKENRIYVVSRKPRVSSVENVFYIQGNATSYSFFQFVVQKGYDVIVDFMIWSPNALAKRLPMILRNCGQYIAAGTASEYAPTDELITESSPRLYDLYTDEEREQTSRYHIKKSKTDNLIMDCSESHWTIFRPWVTYNTRKNPLVTIPESVWVWRYLNEKVIFLPKAVMDKHCSLTSGDDAARAISKLVGNPRAMGEVVNIASDKTMLWSEVVDTYQRVLWELHGEVMKIYLLEDASVIWKNIPSQFDPLSRDRYYNRQFCTEKLNRICGETFVFSDLYDGLKKCMTTVLTDPLCKLEPPAPAFNGLMDRLSGEETAMFIYPKKMRKAYRVAKNPARSWIRRTYRYAKENYRYLYSDPYTFEMRRDEPDAVLEEHSYAKNADD